LQERIPYHTPAKIKFFRNKNNTSVRISPETMVPVTESSGFFILSSPLGYRVMKGITKASLKQESKQENEALSSAG
jgi:hypothetical protein